jgi:hypothetical protein
VGLTTEGTAIVERRNGHATEGDAAHAPVVGTTADVGHFTASVLKKRESPVLCVVRLRARRSNPSNGAGVVL